MVTAFWQLSTCRSMTSMGTPGPIPWTAIHHYAEVQHLTKYEDLYDRFVSVVSAADSEFLEVQQKRAEANQEKMKNGGN